MDAAQAMHLIDDQPEGLSAQESEMLAFERQVTLIGWCDRCIDRATLRKKLMQLEGETCDSIGAARSAEFVARCRSSAPTTVAATNRRRKNSCSW